MECFCHKLSTQQFHNITESETAILKTWAGWAELSAHPLTPPDEHPAVQARRKRSTSASMPRARKRLRTLPDSSSMKPIIDLPGHQSLQVTPPLSTSVSNSVSNLIKTYSCQNAEKVFGAGGHGLDIQQGSGDRRPFVKIFLAIERSDQNIEAQQLIRRTCCYGFALLHQKNSSIDLIIQVIKHALPHAQNSIRDKVYQITRIGEKWKEILGDFASIHKCDPQQLRGLLCLISSTSTWERAKPEDRQSALAILSTNSDILERTLQYTPLVQSALDQMLLEHSFVDETRRLTSHSQPLLSATAMPRSDHGSLPSRAIPARRDLNTPSGARSAWNAYLAAVSEAVGSSGTSSEDAQILLLLLSFLSTSDKIPLDLFCGAMPRKRWTAQGEIDEVDAIHVGLAPELRNLLSDNPRLRNAFHQLDLSSAVSKDHDQTYTLDEAVASRVRERLLAGDLSFWRGQALVVAYRAIPWKYIQSATPNTKLFLPHLKHALEAFQDCYDSLPTSTRADLGLTLVEASRFPNMAWKRFAVGQAEIASRGLEDWYLTCCIAQSQSLLSRIAGNMDHAASCISDLVQGLVGSAMDKRMHSAIGQATIQRSLNCIQVEDLSTAKRWLEGWDPLGQTPSVFEKVVFFRKHMMLGRLLRFQGAFRESLMHFENAQTTIGQHKDLIFDEDLRDLTCDHADTLRELDDPMSAENLLRAEIIRRDQSCISSGNSLLELSLAEALFAQGRFQEADKLCLDIQSRPGLLKVEKLRLHITMAKIRHVESDNEGALCCWSGAFKEIRKFQLTNGRTTRIIVMSICDTLTSLGQTWLVDESLKQVASLDAIAKPGGVQWWIAGMRHWVEYLQSRSLRSRM